MCLGFSILVLCYSRYVPLDLELEEVRLLSTCKRELSIEVLSELRYSLDGSEDSGSNAGSLSLAGSGDGALLK